MSAVDRIAILPPSEAAWKAMRCLDVTSTEASALFGLSPYMTAFELWHQKNDGVVVDIGENERMDWGNDLQDSIAASLARRYGVEVVRVSEYMRLMPVRMGASFDFEIIGVTSGWTGVSAEQAILRKNFEQHGPGILEIKNVDSLVFKDKWVKRLDDEDTGGSTKYIEPPGHIDIQLQHQLHVRDRAWGAIGVLVGGNNGRLVLRERMPDVGAGLEARIGAFWKSIEDGEPPAPVYPGDAEFVCKLYGHAEPNRVFDGRGNGDLVEIAREYREAGEREKLAKEDKQVAKAKLLTAIGDAERAYLDGFTISAAVVGGAHIEYDRNPYRGFRLTAKK